MQQELLWGRLHLETLLQAPPLTHRLPRSCCTDPPALTPVLSLMLEQSSVMSAPLSSVMSVMPLRLLESSMAQSLERLSCWYCRAGSWMAWISMLESTSFPTLCREGKQVMKQIQAGYSCSELGKPKPRDQSQQVPQRAVLAITKAHGHWSPLHLPEEHLLHGGDRGTVAGDAQLLPPLLQLREQGLKPEQRRETSDTDTHGKGHSGLKTLWASVLQLAGVLHPTSG